MNEQTSLFTIATVLVRNSWRILGWAIVGGLVALAMVITKPKLYPASFAFVPEGSDQGGLASLAGQFGISAPFGNQAKQPEFYLALMQSREILAPIVLDTFVVRETGGRPVQFLDLFEIRGSPPSKRLENGLQKLRARTNPSVVRTAGIVRVVVRTEWPSVSLAISQSLLSAVNAYNLRTRQSQASAERKFVEGRLAEAGSALAIVENQLEDFLARNRSGINSSPALHSEWQRIERDVAAKTTILTNLRQEYEDARIREVRDTPTITVFESPAVSPTPEPRGRLGAVLLGLLLGGALGTIVSLTSAILSRRRSLADPDADEFFGALTKWKSSALSRLAIARRRQS